MRLPKDPNELIPKRIKAIRMRAELTQEEFAWQLGTGTGTISQIERGKRCLSADTALKIREKFGTSLDYLFGFTPYEEGEPSSSKMSEDLLNAQNLIEMQKAMIKDLRGKLDAIQDVLNGKINIKLE